MYAILLAIILRLEVINLKNINLLSLLVLILLLLASCTKDGSLISTNDQKQVASIEEHAFMRIHYIYAGQADATLLQIKEDDDFITMLIDTGDWKRDDVLTYLQNENISHIDLIAITHPHADHIGQLDIILDSLRVDEVWMNGDTNNAQTFANALKAIEENDVDYYEPTAGESFEVGPLTIDVIHPNDPFSKTNKNSAINNNSLVMHIQYGDLSFLFTGDAEHEAEKEMLKGNYNLNANILHVGHHGSKTSNSEEFLEAVNAETAIYSAGINNSYGLPDEEVVDRLKKKHKNVHGTDVDGTIIVETDGKDYKILTESDGTLPPPLKGNTCVDINTASATDLQKIIHIGEKSAEELVELRPFDSINELVKIKGIGAQRLEEIKEQKLACIGG